MRMDGEMGDENGNDEVGERKKAGWYGGKILSAFFFYLTGWRDR